MLRPQRAVLSLALLSTLSSGSDAQVRERVYRPTVTPTPTIQTATPTHDTVGTMTLARPMPAPSNLTVTGTPATASLRWESAPGAVGYHVSRTEPAGNAVTLTATAITETGFEDKSGGLKPGGTYTYRVTAVHSNGGVGTAQASFTPPAPAVPDSVRVETRGSERTLLWGSVPGAGSYHVIETWMQPVQVPVFKTVYSADGTTTTVQTGYQTRYEQTTRSYVLTAPQSSLTLGPGVSGHRFDVGAAYAPSGITAPRSQWRFTIAP